MKKFKFKINGSAYEVSVNETEKNVAEIEVNGTPFTVEIEAQEKPASPIKKTPGKVDPIATPARASKAAAIKAPLPGSIVKVLVQAGQAVKQGDVLMTMESMKMENNILAESDGVVKTIKVQPGQSVMQDDVLIEFEGAAAASAEAPAAAAPTTAPASTGKPAKPVKSPLPGSILKVVVTPGQAVKKGDLLLTLESMKMENTILAEKDGVVREVLVAAGQSVMQDDTLVTIE